LLIEKYAGALPLWLSPTQAVIIPINAEYDEYAKKVEAAMLAKGMRVEIDSRNETMGKRIREAQLQKTPYMIVVGANEAESGTVSVRARGGIDCGVMSIEDMVAKLAEEIETKKR
jgi:threonyl-tRNA synthetase